MNNVFFLLKDIDEVIKTGDIISVEKLRLPASPSEEMDGCYIRLLKRRYHKFLKKTIIQDVHQKVWEYIYIQTRVQQKDLIKVGTTYHKSKNGWQLNILDEYYIIVELSLGGKDFPEYYYF